MRTSRIGLLFTVPSAIFLVAGILVASSTAILAGRIIDSSGAVIVGVKVEATNVQTNISFVGETNPEGLYTIPDLPPGIYRVTVQKPAFQTVVKPGVELQVRDVVSLNFSMAIGSVTESITVQAGAPLIQTDASRGGNFKSREVSELPLVGLNPISLARTLPGVVELPGSVLYTAGVPSLSVNGQRFRSNNYLLDGTDNNEIVYTGVAQPFSIADAVEDVSVQTGNFGVESGRAGGGIVNIVTKSGTNDLHGTLLWRYQSQRFDSVSNVSKLQKIPKSVFTRNVYGFTVGGPVRENKTFFFGAFQGDTLRSTRNFPALRIPTEAAVARLRSLFPSNPRLDLYLRLLGNLRGTGSPAPLQLGIDPQTGIDRGAVQFASAAVARPASEGGPQWMAKVDHNRATNHRVAFRYIADSRRNSPISATFPGFTTDTSALDRNLLVSDHYWFSPAWTNEFRFSYARQESHRQQRIAPDSVSEASRLPRISIPNVSTPGIISPEFSKANNLLFQETQTKLSGRHTFRYGVEFLSQRATQRAGSFSQGMVSYTNATGYSAFANFLDNFSGPSGAWRKDFNAELFHPDQFRHSYFFQDTWLPLSSLTLTLGLRYENFGQVANTLRFPAFAGFDPAKFLEPNRVNTDNNNFGPAFGLAWSPRRTSGWLGRVLGEAQTVVRGGFQVSYEPFFTQIVSLMLATSSPNAISVDDRASGTTDRGSPDWFEREPVGNRTASIMDAQAGVLDKDLRSPYTERWSFGIQREFSNIVLIDGSYVGTVGHKLTTWSDFNPRQLNNQPLHPGFGPRRVRTSEGNSSYHGMQWRVERRFTRGFQANASYTWSKYLDSGSEGVGAFVTQGNQSNLTSVPIAQGGLKLDHGPSDYDRPHRLTIVSLWNLPSPAQRFWRHTLSGWTIAVIASFQSGAPYTVMNGLDRNNDGWTNDRPDIGNPRAPVDSRAIVNASCSTGYLNPDTGSCVSGTDVRWVQTVGLPTASTVGRNTLRTGGVNNLDVALTKAIAIGEGRRLEFRWEAFNVLNHPQFTQVPTSLQPEMQSFDFRSVLGAPPGRFLNRDFTDSGIRRMWGQLKLHF